MKNGGGNMKKVAALKALQDLDKHGAYVFSKGDLEKLFPNEQEKAFEKSLQRLVEDGILERVCKGVYLNPLARSKGAYVIEDIACVLRRGCFSYLSLETMLSEYGLISQVPLRRITVMTTGARGVVATPYGSIEFTHTKRRPSEIIGRSVAVKNRPMRIASETAAVQDLRRVGRNLDMIQPAEERE
jgi:predicted transcriptional regulator of viral defense system